MGAQTKHVWTVQCLHNESTQDTNIQHLYDETPSLPIHEHLQLHASQYKQKTQHPSHLPHKHTTYFNTPKLKNPLFLTTAATQQTFPQSLQHTQEAITKYCAHLHHTLAALKRDFPASLVAPLPSSEQTNLPTSNHTYTKSTPKHIHHHYAPSVTSTHTTHIISSTAPTYAPHCQPWNCGQTPPERLHCWPDGRRSWLVDHKREHRTHPLARVMGVGRQQLQLEYTSGPPVSIFHMN